MAIEYSLNKIKNFFVGKDILGRDAIVHSVVTFRMKRVPKEMAGATRAGPLSRLLATGMTRFPLLFESKSSR